MANDDVTPDPVEQEAGASSAQTPAPAEEPPAGEEGKGGEG